MTFEQFMLKQSYEKLSKFGDRLHHFKGMINWNKFRPIIKKCYRDNKDTGGRPHTDEILIVRTLVLQSMYNLSDPELEFQCHDRLSFRNFLDFPENVPDFSTIWKARERIREHNAEKKIWKELQRQFDNKGLDIKTGVIQDATFIHKDPGKKRQYQERKLKKEGDKPEYTSKQESHIDRDSSYAVKNNQIHHGYKSHIKVDIDSQLIRSYDVTTASVHDNQIDLVEERDVAAYRDKGYFGSELTAKGVIDKTMQRATRARKLNGGQQKRNRAISRLRAPGERPFGVIKKVFHGWYTQVTTLQRVKIKEMFKCFTFNMYQLVTLST
jgi:transposase, IS5 family